MREMKHKNVIEMYDVYDVGWMTCIVMEMCEGGDLLGVCIVNLRLGGTPPLNLGRNIL